MIERCFWCGELIGKEKPSDYSEITLSICNDCAQMLRKKYRMSGVLGPQDIDVLIKLLAK